MSITFLQLAQKVLTESKHALTVEQIWQRALQKGFVDELNSSGKTPIHTLGAQLYVACKAGESSKFSSTGSRPKQFYLRAMESMVDKAVPAGIPEPKPTEKTNLLEKQLHPLMAYFARYELHAYCKTINHSKSAKGSYAQWTHPDMVGCYYPDWSAPTRDLSKALGAPNVKLYSFELKRELTFNNLRESFFQAVSNSSWANEGYLCAAGISQDPDFRSELQRLSQSFGIGVIEIDLDDPDATATLYPSRERELDWESINKLCDINPDFQEFVLRVKTDLNSNEVRVEKYDAIGSAEKLKQDLSHST